MDIAKDNSSAEAVDILAKKVDLNETRTIDKVRTGIIAGLNLIPGVGGALATLADGSILELKQARLIAFVEDLASTIDAIQDQVKVELVHTGAFADMFEQTLTGVANNYQAEKIAAYKAIFINSLTGSPSVTNEEQEIFLRLVSSLAVRHIKILAILAQNHSGNLVKVVQASYPDYDKEAIYYIMDDLRNNGLLPAKPIIYDEDLSVNFNQLSKMGEKFVDFITF